jgi:hypothetical protein
MFPSLAPTFGEVHLLVFDDPELIADLNAKGNVT